MPWFANNNPAGDIRAPALSAALRQQKAKADAVEKRVWSHELRTVLLEDVTGSPNAGSDGTHRCHGLVHPDQFPAAVNGDSTGVEFVYPRQHAQFVVAVRADPRVAVGCIALSNVQLINLELCVGQTEQWSLFQEPVPMINAIAIEMRPLHPERLEDKVTVNATEFATALGKYTWQRILTENERLVMRYKDGIDYFVRVLEIDAADDSETEFTMPDSFRGAVDEDTQVFVSLDGLPSTTFELLNAKPLQTSLASLRSDVVTVITSDEEEFPVKKKLLFPCIKLTSAVLSGKGVHNGSSSTITVNVDCCTFDRVLLYLEHEARNDGTEFKFDPNHTEDLLAAATTVGCMGLEDVCKKRLGEFDSRVRKEGIRWEEVVRRNNSGEIWLVMSGMVFDVTRWLPEHPGGSVIIPREALNVDCTVMFEIYHSSRQSFRYLKQFYIGDIDEGDLTQIPPSAETPSAAFVEELNEVSLLFCGPVRIRWNSSLLYHFQSTRHGA
ncbi:TPA: hypothetical protein N0F65_002270 [Lagenidium giganteum]|uniref:Cytochrome b5 heme-binding domain-containing protein n=1 Tax=Lagenidium giganteum TaxID=4803 RepID=A0AAV2YNA8_9STRA|nr:TPA: hypothetical protein N0F65_002270 [Lagenidium giganteum]